MAYVIKCRFYGKPDQFGESYIVESDDEDINTFFEIGSKVLLTPAQTKQPVEPKANRKTFCGHCKSYHY